MPPVFEKKRAFFKPISWEVLDFSSKCEKSPRFSVSGARKLENRQLFHRFPSRRPEKVTTRSRLFLYTIAHSGGAVSQKNAEIIDFFTPRGSLSGLPRSENDPQKPILERPGHPNLMKKHHFSMPASIKSEGPNGLLPTRFEHPVLYYNGWQK